MEVMGCFKTERPSITIVMVTHELDISHYCKRNLILRDGVTCAMRRLQNRSIAEDEINKLKAAETAARLHTAAA